MVSNGFRLNRTGYTMAPLFKPSLLQELFSSISQIDQAYITPFSHLLSSFSTPTPDEETAIKAAIQESSRHESIIEKALLQLEDIGRALQERRWVHRKYQSDHQGMVSALRSLPPELLSNIFLMCTPPDNPNTCSTFKFILDHPPPWSIARVCRKWRYISHSTPLLWVDSIPTIDLNRSYKSGFFNLLNTVVELSFPHDLNLRLRDPKDKDNKIQPFKDILPRIHSLDVHQANLPLIKALVQRRESFKRLNTANIAFSTTSSYKRPPRLDFLAKVTCLTLSFSWDEIDDEEEVVNNPTRYALLRSVDFQWPNLTTFRGALLPNFYLRTILFAAPLLQRVTMHDLIDVSFEPTTPPAPSSVVRHTNLKDLQLTAQTFDSLSRQTLHHLQLPGLQYLHIEHRGIDDGIIVSVLEQTQDSVLKLYLGASLWQSERPRAFSLCPLLEELTLCFATADDLEDLTISSDSRLCPTLRRLSLPDFLIESDDEAHTVQEFLVSRGLVPFNTSHIPHDCHQLESVSVSLASSQSVSIFQRHFLNVDTSLQTIQRFMETVGLRLSTHPTLLTHTLQISLDDLDVKQRLEGLHNELHSLAPHFLILFEVCDILLFSLHRIN